jgi:predicted  nucleic acid-binding Zn-ribbon protein
VSQALPLREQLKALENLQEIDLKVDSLKKSKASLPGVLKSLDDQLAKLKTSIDLKQRIRDDLEKNLKQNQAALDINRDRQTRANAKLAAVSNSHEFQAASKEIEQLKKLSGTIEDQSKRATTDGEAMGKDIIDLNAQYEKLKTERDAQATQLEAQGSKFDTEMSSLAGERKQFTSKVDPRTLTQYDRVRGARAGLGIAPAIGGRCKGCNIMVPPQLFNEIQRCNQLHQCPSCHRILYVSAPSPTAQAAAGA